MYLLSSGIISTDLLFVNTFAYKGASLLFIEYSATPIYFPPVPEETIAVLLTYVIESFGSSMPCPVIISPISGNNFAISIDSPNGACESNIIRFALS